MSDAQMRAHMLNVANDYDKLAEQATKGGVSPAQGSAELACLSVRSDQRTPLSQDHRLSMGTEAAAISNGEFRISAHLHDCIGGYSKS
jgi:hypothetical protein